MSAGWICDKGSVSEPRPEHEDQAAAGADVVPIAPDLTTRVGAILESVQREADRIIDEARAEAQRARGEAAPTAPGPVGGTEEEAEAQALRVAMQMAAVGCTRAQVDSHLRAYLRCGDPAPVLDRVFGMATGPGARVDWALRPRSA